MNPKHIYLDDKKADDTQRHGRPQVRHQDGAKLLTRSGQRTRAIQ